MCGIAGLVLRHADPNIGRALRRMGDGLSHRGPDGQGFAVVENDRFKSSTMGLDLPAARIGLAHRRLSIIDLSDAAQQPMCDERGRNAITYNGEIYNYVELRTSVLGGRVFKSGGDTEVLFRLVADRWTENLD